MKRTLSTVLLVPALLVQYLAAGVEALRARSELTASMSGLLQLENIYPSDDLLPGDRMAELIAEDLANQLIGRTLNFQEDYRTNSVRRRLLYLRHKTAVKKHIFTDFSHPIKDSVGAIFDATSDPSAKCANMMTGWARCFFTD